MTHVSRPRQSVGSALGNAVGGIAGQLGGNYIGQQFTNKQEKFEFERNRSRLQEALGGLKDLNPDSTPFEVTQALISATAGIPGSERYVGALYQPLMQALNQKRTASGPGAVVGPPGGAPQPQPQPQPQGQGQGMGASGQQTGNFIGQQGQGSFNQPQNQQTQQPQQPSLFNIIQPSTPLTGNISDPNLGNAAVPKVYSPEDIQNIHNYARQNNLSPEAEETLVNDANSYNDNSRKAYSDLVSGYNLQEKIRGDTIANQNSFIQYMDKEAPEFSSNPDEKQLALIAAEKYANEPSQARRLQKVKQELRPYQAAKKALERTLERPLFGYTPEQLQHARNAAQVMVQNGQKDQLRLMIAKGGHGDIEEAMLLNPLPRDVDKQFNSIPALKDPLSHVTTLDPESKQYSQQLEKGQKSYQKGLDTAKEIVKANFTTGTWENPGTNILLLRKHLMDKKIPYERVALIMDEALKELSQEREGFKLDPHQEIDFQKLGYPPLGAEDYLQNVMNYTLFGKE